MLKKTLPGRQHKNSTGQCGGHLMMSAATHARITSAQVGVRLKSKKFFKIKFFFLLFNVEQRTHPAATQELGDFQQPAILTVAYLFIIGLSNLYH